MYDSDDRLFDIYNLSPEVAAMSSEERAAELDRHRRGPLAVKWAPSDLREAHAQIAGVMAGRRLPSSPHPLAQRAMQDGGNPSLINMAKQFAEAQFPEARAWDTRQILAAATTTGHLSGVLSDVVNQLVIERTPQLLGKALRICRPIELNDFRQTELGTVQLDAELPAANTVELRQWETITPTGSSEAMQLLSAPIRARFSEMMIVDDRVDALIRTMESTLVAAAQAELETCFGILSDNGALDDAANLFNATDGNLLTSQTKDVAGVGAGVNALRGMLINTKASDADARFLIVPSADEALARSVVVSMSVGSPWLEIIPSAYMSGGWIIMADPTAFPTLARGTMRGSNGVSLTFGQGVPNNREGSKDIIFEGLHSYDYGAVSRTGAVRLEF